jgi:hypothetical protein
VVPAAAVLTGLFPVEADPLDFLVYAGGCFVLQQATIALLGRGFVNPGFSLLFEVIRLPSNLAATLALLLPGTGLFAVTAKGRTGDDRARARVPPLLVVLACLLAFTAPWSVLSLAGLTPTRYAAVDGALVPEVWLLLSLGFVLAAIRRIRSPRFATERREGHRFPAPFPATLSGRPGSMVDVSLGGAQIRVPGPGLAVGTVAALAVMVPDRVEPLLFSVAVRSRSGEQHRLQFLGRPWVALAAMSATTMGAGAARWVLPAAEVGPPAVPAPQPA